MEIGAPPRAKLPVWKWSAHANGNVSMATFRKPSYLNVYKPPGASLAHSFSVKVFLSFSLINNAYTIVFRSGLLLLIQSWLIWLVFTIVLGKVGKRSPTIALKLIKRDLLHTYYSKWHYFTARENLLQSFQGKFWIWRLIILFIYNWL